MIRMFFSRQKRDDVVVATKVRFQMGQEPNSVGLGRRHIIKNCEDSLERLQTDYIDLYQVGQIYILSWWQFYGNNQFLIMNAIRTLVGKKFRQHIDKKSSV